MRTKAPSELDAGRSLLLASALCAILIFALSVPAAAQSPELAGCRLQGSWVAELDVPPGPPGRFFTQYAAGANATTGPLTLEWIEFDPTLGGAFASAVRATQGVGEWRLHGQSYDYVWVAYGLDIVGNTLYTLRSSGTGTFQGCGTIVFDWVLDVEVPTPGGPLLVSCLAGTGTKQRIPLEPAACSN